MDTVVCPKCNEENQGAALHCTKCGASLRDVAREPGISSSKAASTETPPYTASLTRGRLENIREIAIGFVGWFVVNTFFHLARRFLFYDQGPGALIMSGVFVLALVPMNIIAPIYLWFRKPRWIAAGALSALAVNSIGLILLARDSLIELIILAVPFYLTLINLYG